MSSVPPPPPPGAGAADHPRSPAGIAARIGLLGIAYLAGTLLATPLVVRTDDEQWGLWAAVVAAAVVLGAVATPGDVAAKARGAVIGGAVVAGAGPLAFWLVFRMLDFLDWLFIDIVWHDIIDGNNDNNEEGLHPLWTR